MDVNDIKNKINKIQVGAKGNLSPIYLGDSDAPYGYLEYLPESYDDHEMEFPLIIFLHGAGEVGNSKLAAGDILQLLNYGPPSLIKHNNWNPPEPMVVLSPQCHTYGWKPVILKDFIRYAMDQYNVDESRIYLTGVSMGGFGTFSYLEEFSNRGNIAAAIPICGGGQPSKARALKNIPIWAFHGEEDSVVDVNHSIRMIESINKFGPVEKAKLTIYPGIKHDSWTMTYDHSGMGKESIMYDPFDINIWEWMLQHSFGKF